MEAVSPIQLAIRLLIPAESRLLELEEIRRMIGPFDTKALVYPWKNVHAEVDRVCEELQDIVAGAEKGKENRTGTFARMSRVVNRAAKKDMEVGMQPVLPARATVPYLNEPWYC